MNIGWPEGIWIANAVIILLVAAANDGEPRRGKHSLAGAMLGTGLAFALMYWGGFFA